LGAACEEKPIRRPNLSLLALVSFIASFGIARTFTTLSPHVVTVVFGFHIHHYWYGLIMLAVGGWLGISYNEERIDRVAAVIYGAGGGLIGDEAGLLLTLGNYWTRMTYTIIVVFLVFISALVLFKRYSKAVVAEIQEFTRRRSSLYVGVFLAVFSTAFILSENLIVFIISSIAEAVGCIIIVTFIVERIARHTLKT
jgi:hypothetical protein